MEIITAPEKYVPAEQDVVCFLAGGITNCVWWQTAVIDQLKKFTANHLVICNPRRENFPIDSPGAADEQIAWEFDNLEMADIFSMYFSSGESDQPICMYELGRNIVRTQDKFPDSWKDRLVITVESGYRRTKDVFVQTALATDEFDLAILGNDFNEAVELHAKRIYEAYTKICEQWGIEP